MSPLPFDVHILLFDDGWTPGCSGVATDELRHVSRGRLMPTRSAAEALDHQMQRINGPRV
jgi:hypothetical protein